MTRQAAMNEALTYLADARYHRVFHLASRTPSHQRRDKRFRVTYSDIGRPACENEDEEAGKATVFFCGGLFAGRWFGACIKADLVLKARGVRLINIDRPGMGGTDEVPLSERLNVFMEIVPALLAHLKIRHVSVACHSGGVVYAMNLIMQHRHLLHPQRPTLDIFAPWVHGSHSGKTAMVLTDLIPRGCISRFHHLVELVNNGVLPVFLFSSGVVVKTFGIDYNPAWETKAESSDCVSLTENERRLEWYMNPELPKYIAAESVRGVSDEVLLLLKRTNHSQPWGLWDDTDDYVSRLAAQETTLRAGKDTPLLKIRTYYAASDNMIGKQGSRWFDGLWTTEACGGVIDFASRTCPGTTHESILDRKSGILNQWAVEVGKPYAVVEQKVEGETGQG